MSKSPTILIDRCSVVPQEDDQLGRFTSMEALKTTSLEIVSLSSAVLIVGKAGTDKESLARFIHNSSPRSECPFIPVACCPSGYAGFDLELFGSVSYSGSSMLGSILASNGGTLFLDDIDQLSLPLQARLLNVLETGTVVSAGDCRSRPVKLCFMAAASTGLETQVQAGAFRSDLFRHLSVTQLNLLPLRERPQDILPLAEHSLRVQSQLFDEPLKNISPAVAMALESYSWPGNDRELVELMQQCHMVATSGTLKLDSLPARLLSVTTNSRCNSRLLA